MTSKTWVAGTVIDSPWLQDVDDSVYFSPTKNYVNGTIGAILDTSVYASSFPSIIGDGTTNDTSAIQTAQAYNPTAPFEFGPKTYLVDAGVLLFQGSVRGASNFQTQLLASSGTTGFVVRVKTTSGQWSAQVCDLFINCQGAGQNGVVLEGSYGTAERIKIWHGTGIGFQLGNASASSGCFWWTVSSCHTNCLVSGGTGLVIDSSPGGANANTLVNFYTAGLFTTGWDIRGIGNRIGGTVEWQVGCVDVVKISGISNTIPSSSYFESVAGAVPSGKLFNVTGNSNTVESLHLQASLTKSLDYYITDTGLGNRVQVAKSLRYTSTVNQSLKNYFPGYRFDYFPAATQAYGFGAAAGVSQDLTTVYQGNPTMKMTLAASASNASCVFLTGGSGVTNYPLAAFAGKTISFSAACKTTLAGYGGMTYTIVAGSGTTNGTTQCSHSGSGNWEVFADTIQIPTDVTQITITLKSHLSGTVGTGDVWFANPTLVFGRETSATSDALKSINELVLDQGAFTPTISGTTTAGAGTYTTQIGRYQRIGKRVFFEISLVWTAHTGTGNLSVTGLPFTSANITANHTPAVNVNFSNLVVGAGKQLTAQVANNGTTIFPTASDVAGGAFAFVAIDAAASLWLSGQYEIA